EIDIEEEEPEEDPVEDPKPLAGHGDQFDAHPNPQPRNMNGWEDDDENEDVDIEEDNDAEIIFPYEEADDELKVEEAGVEPEVEEASVEPEVEDAGDEPEPEGADVELEAEEPDGAPEASIGTGSQRPFVVRDFPIGFYEVGESSTTRDPQFVGGLAPWVLRRDLEALRRQERIREAESETSRTEVALLGSEAKIGKMEREILHHDLSGVEETLGKMVERLKVLKSEENATLTKKLAEKERLSESIWWNEIFYLEMLRKGAVPKPPSDDEGFERPRKMPKKSDEDEGPSDPRAYARDHCDQFATSMNEFMANMNNGAGESGGASGSGGAGGSGGASGNADGTGVRGAGPTVPELTGCSYATFIKCDPLPFNGTEGTLGLCQWFEKLELSVIQRMEQELYNLKMKGMDIDGYTNRFNELALLCLRMVEPEAVKVEQYLRGLTKSICGDVTSSQPATINDAVCLAYQLVGQLIQDKADEATKGEKKKGEGDRGSHGDNRREHNRRQNQRR
nr:hypothetical protein [Tanacetum cinerariifolium]